MGISPADKAMEYVNFAEHCLKIARALPDREDRVVHREMAAEWTKLAQTMAEGAAHSAREQAGKTRTKAVS